MISELLFGVVRCRIQGDKLNIDVLANSYTAKSS